MEADKGTLYLELYEQADKLIKQYNPCEINNGKCKRGHFCCGGCTYLVDNECSVKSILCKTWLCGHLDHEDCLHNELLDGLQDIFMKAWEKDLLVIRGSIADVLIKSPEDVGYFKRMIVDMPWGVAYKLRTPRKNQYGGSQEC